MKTTEAIIGYLRQQYDAHNGKDLLDFYLLHEGALETQVNVAAGEGRPVPGRTSTYADENGNEWWSIRVPKKADSEPEWVDYHLKWPLELHAEAIGSTGWDWRAKVSRYVGFDFDAIAGHAQGVGVTDETLEKVRQAAQELPYVTVRRSTGGAGIHLYVFFADGVPTANHSEHAALARAVLGMMSHEAGFNFAAQIDACGGNMWIYHRKSTKENRGLELIKKGEPLTRVPGNWRDHLEVVSRKRAKVKLDGIDDQNTDNFDRLTSSHRAVPLDEQHHAHITALEKAGFCCVWVQDHNLLQTHTVGFQQIADEAAFGIKGIYKTNSTGKDPATPNCFAFPGENGSWRIYRFSPGITEAETWEQDGQGWTTCVFNRPAKLKTAARALKAKELKKGFEFETLADAAKALEVTGVTIEVDEPLKDRKAVIKTLKDGRLSVEVDKVKPKRGVVGDPDAIGNWSNADCKDRWTQIIDGPPVDDTPQSNPAATNCINRVRCFVDGDKVKYCLLDIDKQWVTVSSSDLTKHIRGFGYKSADADIIINQLQQNNYRLTYSPFGPEYPEPGERLWNRDAPQFSCEPKPGDTHHWWKILNHVGKRLDEPVANNDWCRKYGIKTGAEYLFAWIASMFRRPFQPLPFLFFYSVEQNLGKSTLVNALITLFRGAHGALQIEKELLRHDFNGSMKTCVFAYVNEINLGGDYDVYNLVKCYVDSDMLKIRGMHKDGRNETNTTHWMQTTNHPEYAPVWPGDTRVVVVRVDRFDGPEIAWKEKLKPLIIEENPAFIHEILSYEFPPSDGRLFLPVLSTPEKEGVIKEREAEARDWYFVLRELATEGKIDGLLASEVYTAISNRGVDRLPKNQQGLSVKIKNAEMQLRKDGFSFACAGSPLRFTIKPEAAL